MFLPGEESAGVVLLREDDMSIHALVLKIMHTTHTQHTHAYCTAPLLRPPLFVTYFQEKEGGGHNNKDVHFCLAIKPLLPRICVLRSMKLSRLCSRRRELLRLTCHGSTEGWPRHFLQNIADSLAAKTPPTSHKTTRQDDVQIHWPQETVRDQ